jgi:hypothetical protein
LDTEPESKRKSKAYAMAISLLDPAVTPLDINLVEWPLLKAGLKSLIEDFGPETNWPTRLLVNAYAAKDREAAKEALKIINGNYSPEILVHPEQFQDLAKWAEEDPPQPHP